MNREERDQLRDKHKPVKWNNGFVSCDVCTEIIEENDYPVLYPCDVIRVLDTTEYPPEGQNVECDHYGVDSGGTDYYGTSNPPQEWDWNYSYCPMCGVKL